MAPDAHITLLSRKHPPNLHHKLWKRLPTAPWQACCSLQSFLNKDHYVYSPTELHFFLLQGQLLLRNPPSAKHMESGLKDSEPQLLCLQKGLKSGHLQL